MGKTRILPEPFFVLASQNPIELEGTCPLPEAQLDRFLFKLEVKNADAATLKEIIYTRRHGQPPEPAFRVSPQELDELFSTMNSIYLPGPVAEYIARLVHATDPSSEAATELVSQYVQYGASPRAAIAVAEAARGIALLARRPTVGFEDVRQVVIAALNHRILLNYKAKFAGVDSAEVLQDLLKSIKETDLGLDQEIEIAATGS
jgi:MoxR-like ATPase